MQFHILEKNFAENLIFDRSHFAHAVYIGLEIPTEFSAHLC